MALNLVVWFSKACWCAVFVEAVSDAFGLGHVALPA